MITSPQRATLKLYAYYADNQKAERTREERKAYLAAMPKAKNDPRVIAKLEDLGMLVRTGFNYGAIYSITGCGRVALLSK